MNRLPKWLGFFKIKKNHTPTPRKTSFCVTPPRRRSINTLLLTGHLTEIKYAAIAYIDSDNNLADSNQFTDMFSYTTPGAVAGKLLQVNKTHTYNNNFQPQKAVGSLSVA